jgi:raffinose/stachyose/melibiose transport system substrate-binding protein
MLVNAVLNSRRVLACLATVAVVGIAGCGGSDDKAASSGSGKVALKGLFASSQKPAMDAMIKGFEAKNPLIDIKETYVPSSSITELLPTQIRAGNMPDLVQLGSGKGRPDSVLTLAPSGTLLDLSNEPWKGNLLPALQPALQFENKLYGYPTQIFFYGAVYNTELFSQLKLTVPTTFADVLTMCKTIAAAGKIPFSQSFVEPGDGAGIGQQRMHQYVYSPQPDWSDQRTAGKVTFANTPGWKKTFESILQMKDAKCFGRGAEGATAAQQFEKVARGQAVMSILASSQVGSITSINKDIKLGFFEVPADQADQTVAPYSESVLGVSAKTKHPEQAKKFLAYMADTANAAEFAKLTGGSSTTDVANGVMPDFMQDMVPLVKAGKIQETANSFWPAPSLRTEMGEGIQGLLIGKRKVDDLLASMDAIWDKAIKSS